MSVPTTPAVDLDALEREGAPGPFTFVLGGRTFIMSDPQDVDWQDLLAAMQNPVMFFRLVLPADDQVEFFRTRLAAWKMNKLMESYQQHYGLPNAGNAAGLPR